MATEENGLLDKQDFLEQKEVIKKQRIIASAN